jgi:hypothetical protein
MDKKIDPYMILKIAGMDIEVFLVPGDGESFGDFTYIQGQIRIDSRLKKGALVDTLLHEVLHAIWAVGHLKSKREKEERAVSVTATTLTQIFRDNPHFMKWITKNLV